MTATDDAAQRVSFYFSAHADDWQLFMNPPAFRDVLDKNTRCVFIHVTAGDGGLGTTNGGRKHPYFLARENGAESAIRFMADSDNLSPIEPSAVAAGFNGHPIRRVGYRNTAAYFLRLPDGNAEGTGYAGTGFQSLKRLAERRIDKYSAIDGTTTYRGWEDLVTTLRAVIDFERGAARAIALNVPELDPVIDPGAHSDHQMTATAALGAAQHLPRARRLHYAGYSAASRPENLSGQDRDMKCAVYAVTAAGVLAFDHPIPWQHYDQSFVGRNYCRIGEDQDLSS